MATECFHLFRFVTLMSKHVRDLECIMVKGVSFSRFDYYIITDVSDVLWLHLYNM